MDALKLYIECRSRIDNILAVVDMLLVSTSTSTNDGQVRQQTRGMVRAPLLRKHFDHPLAACHFLYQTVRL